MKRSHTSLITGRMAKNGRSCKRGRKAMAQLLEALEGRTMLSTTNWLQFPTAELRQPTPTANTQLQLEAFPPATVYASGSLQYTWSWVGNSYGGYPVTAPDGGTLTFNMVQRTSDAVAAGPNATGSGTDQLPVMAIENGYSEEGNGLSIYQDGQALSTNASDGSGGDRGVVFGGNYVYQARHEKVNAVKYYTVARYWAVSGVPDEANGGAPSVAGTLADFPDTAGLNSGQPYMGNHYVMDGKNILPYIYTTSSNGAQPSALGYYVATLNGNQVPCIYVADQLNNAVWIFNADSGELLSTSGVNGVTLNTSGAQTLTASGTGLSSVTGNVNVRSGISTTALAVTTINKAVAGGAFEVTVSALDADGNIDSTYTGTVHFTATDPSSHVILPGNYTFTGSGTGLDNGVHTFTVTLGTVVGGPWNVSVADDTHGLIASSVPITVSAAGTATKLDFSGVTSNPATGAPISFTLKALDDKGNIVTDYAGTVQFKCSDPQATIVDPTTGNTVNLSGFTYTFDPNTDSGSHTFGDADTADGSSPILATAGKQTIEATDVNAGYLTATSDDIDVQVGTISQFNVAMPDVDTVGTVASGQSFKVVVTAQDAAGNTVADGYKDNTVQLSYSGTGTLATPLPSHKFVASDHGVYTFTVTAASQGTINITATDTTTSLSGSSSDITIVPAVSYTATSFGVSMAGSTTANTPVSVTVTAKKSDGTTDTSYNGTAWIFGSDAQATLPTECTFISGVATFSATFKTAGSQTLKLMDETNNPLIGTSSAITVAPAAVSALKVSAPDDVPGGNSFELTVTAQDAYGNTVPSYNGRVTFTSTDSQATLPNHLDLSSGVGTCNVTLKTTTAPQTVTVTDGTLSDTSDDINVLPMSSVDHLVVKTVGDVASGRPFSLTVTAVDVYGNKVGGYSGTVAITSSDPLFTINGVNVLQHGYSFEFKPSYAGTHTFTALNLSATGSQTVTVTDANNSFTVPSTIQVHSPVSYTATSFSVNGPSTATAGVSFSVTVTAKYGTTTDTTYTGTVHFSSSDLNSYVNLPSNFTFTLGDAGTHTFTGVMLATAGNQTLSVTDTNNNPVTGTSVAIPVAATTATHLSFDTINGAPFSAFTSSTPAVAAGTPFDVVVTARDTYGNVAAGYNGTIGIDSSDTQAATPLDYAMNSYDAGEHAFLNGSFAFSNTGGFKIYDLAIDDTTNHNVWITDAGDGNVYEFSSAGAPLGTPITGLPTAGSNCVAWDHDRQQIAVALGGKVAANDTPIKFYNTSGILQSTFGTSLYSGVAGEMGVSKFSAIADFDIDAAGNLYVATRTAGDPGCADVRVLDPDTGALLYAETTRTHMASAEADYDPVTGVDSVYGNDSYMVMNYANAPGDQWTWKAVTSDPQYTADVRIPGNGASTAFETPNTPVIRHINGDIYMYLLSGTKLLEVLKADDPTFTTSYTFRPVVMISLDSAGNPLGNGFPFGFNGNKVPSGDKVMWIWTDTNADGATEADEFTPYAGPFQWSTGFRDATIDSNGNILFSITKFVNGGDPGLVELRRVGFDASGNPQYNWTVNTDGTDADAGLTFVYAPDHDGQDTEWGINPARSLANSITGTAYDSENHVLYIAGGPSDGAAGIGTVLRAYAYDTNNPPPDHSAFGDGQGGPVQQWSDSYYDANGVRDPNSPISWILTGGGVTHMQSMSAAGDYIFVDSRMDIIYAYKRTDGTLAGQMFSAPQNGSNCSVDNYSSFQVLQKPAGDYIITTEGFWSEAIFHMLAPNDQVPVVSLAQDVKVAPSAAPQQVNFTISAADADGDALSYAIQYGDGTFDRGTFNGAPSVTVSHTYQWNGAFSVDVVVEDGKGGTADALSSVTVGPALNSSTQTLLSMSDDEELDDNTKYDVNKDFSGVGNYVAGEKGDDFRLAGNDTDNTQTLNAADIFPFDLWAAGLRPGDHISTTTLPNISFVLSSVNGTNQTSVDLYAAGMYNTLLSGLAGIGNLYYAGPNDTTPGVVKLQADFITADSDEDTRISLTDPAGQLALANYINAALDAGNRFIVFRLSPQVSDLNAAGVTGFYRVYAREGGDSNAPQLTLTPVARTAAGNTSHFNVASGALAEGMAQYSEDNATFTSVPGKYAGDTYIQTVNGDRSSSGSLAFTINQSATVYVLYDRSITGSARQDGSTGWLTTQGFAPTGDTITSTAGTFDVYAKTYSNGGNGQPISISLGANTTNGSAAGAMYSVVIAPVQAGASNLVGWWKLDEGTGTTVGDAASGNDGAITSANTPVWTVGYLGDTEQFSYNMPGAQGGPNPVVTGTSGRSLHFNGKDTYVSIADTPNPGNVTVSCWARNDVSQLSTKARNGWNGDGYLLYKAGSFYIQPHGGNSQTLDFVAYINGTPQTITYEPPHVAGTQPSNQFNLFQWHQYGLSYDGSTLTAYVDGTAVGSLPLTGTLSSSVSPLVVGGNGSDSFFQGFVDDVRMYNTALSPTQMQSLVSLGAGISAVNNAPTPLATTTALVVSNVSTTMVDTILGKFEVSVPGTATAGSSFSVTITAENTLGDALPTYSGSVQVTSATDPLFSGSTQTVTSGTGTFNTTLYTAGAHETITVTDVATGLASGTSDDIIVSHAAASQLAVTRQPSSTATAGSPFSTQPIVALEDAYGNIVTNDSTHTVTAARGTTGTGTLQGSNLTVTLVNGVASFSGLYYTKAESMNLAFTTNAGGETAASNSVTVSAAAASTLSVSASSSATAGSAISYTLTARDAYGNVAAGYRGTVHFTSTDSQASLPSDYTFTSGDAGSHTFSNVILKTAGNKTVTATDTGTGSIQATTGNIAVSPAAASTFTVSAPGSATGGQAIDVTVTAYDAYGNVATGYTGTVHFTSTDGAASLPSNHAFVSGDQGVHTFSVTLNSSGNQTVTATDTVTGTITGTSGAINVLVSTSVSIAATSNATEGGSSGSFTVTRTGSTSSALTVNYSIGGSAANGTDYTTLSGTVTIASGSSTATITVTPTNDTIAELKETVDLTLTSGTGYSVGSPSQAQVTITDNDTAGFLDNSNLVAYWRLDEGTGTTVNDSAPSGGTADTGSVLSNDSRWGTGVFGSGYHCDKTSNYMISVNNTSDQQPSSALTVSVWAKGDASGNWASGNSRGIVYKANAFEVLAVAGQKYVTFGIRLGGVWKTVNSATVTSTGDWHMYTMTWDGSTLKGYVDGGSMQSTSASGTFSPPSNTMYIGADGGTNSAFAGWVDEARIYNAALSSGDVSTLHGQAALSATGLQHATPVSNLQSGSSLYSNTGSYTFGTVPSQYLGSMLIQTTTADALSTGDKQVGFTLAQDSIVYVMYDDAITGSHRADYNGGWLSSFSDTGVNITVSGHTFSVYKAKLSAGDVWLGGNTADGYDQSGLMYDVFIQSLL